MSNRLVVKMPAAGRRGDPDYAPAYEVHHYYIAKFGRVDAELPIRPDLSTGAPVHMEAIRYAEGCVPPPSEVLYVHELHDEDGIRPEKHLIFSFVAQAQGAIPPAPILPLDQALDAFMDLAFKNGNDEVNWRGPVGINDAIRNLKVSYFSHKPEKLGRQRGDGGRARR